MNTLRTILLSMTCLLLTGAVPSQAQDAETLYFWVNHYKVAPGESDRFLEAEREIWNPVAEHLIQEGEVLNRSVYRKAIQGRDEEGSNYATVLVLSDARALDTFASDENLAAVHGDDNVDAMWERTHEARKHVRADLWERIDVTQTPSDQPVGALQLDCMRPAPGEDDAYIELEVDLWKPIHELRVEDGVITSWQLAEELFPGGTDTPCPYMTINSIPSVGSAGHADLNNLWDRVYPDRDMQEILQQTGEARTHRYSQVWEVLEVVQ